MFKKFFLYFCALTLLTCGHASIVDSNTGFREVKETVIQVQDAKLFCRTIGKGQPLIVIHGGPGLSQDYLLPQMYKHAENHFVIFYDQRGCGQSTGEISPETMTLKMFIDDLESIRKEFKLDKISILGHSWGGFLAMEYAISHPERVEKLILSNTIPASSEEFSLFVQEWIKRTTPFQKELEEIHHTQGFLDGDPNVMEHLHRLIFRTYVYQPEKAELLSLRMTKTASVNGAKVYENIRKNVFEKPFNLHSSLKTLHVPTLVIHGDHDIVPSITAQKIHESIPHSEFVLMHNCGHFPYVEDPVIYFHHLKKFLE